MTQDNKNYKKLSNKQLKEKYRESKDANLVNLYANGIHQLLNIQLLYLDHIEDILKKWGLCVQDTKFNLHTCSKSFNTLERYLQQNINSEKEQSKFNEEFDRLYDALAKYFLIKETEETGETQYEEDKD